MDTVVRESSNRYQALKTVEIPTIPQRIYLLGRDIWAWSGGWHLTRTLHVKGALAVRIPTILAQFRISHSGNQMNHEANKGRGCSALWHAPPFRPVPTR
jgi:hypothetical protein